MNRHEKLSQTKRGKQKESETIRDLGKTRDYKLQHRTKFKKFCDKVYANSSTPQPNEPHRVEPRQSEPITQQFEQYEKRLNVNSKCNSQQRFVRNKIHVN